MDLSASFVLRWLRAALLAAVALLAGVVAHVSAGGLLPAPFVLAMVLLGCVLGAGWLLGRPASTPRVVVLLVAAQTAVHVALTGLAGHRGDHRMSMASSAAGAPAPPTSTASLGSRGSGSVYDQLYGVHAQAAGDASGQLAVPAPVLHMVADITGPHAAMAIAHLAAAAVVGLWLAVGERALWTVIALADRRVRCLVRSSADAIVVAAAVLVMRSRDLLREIVEALRRWAMQVDSSAAHDPAVGRGLDRRGPPALHAA